MSTKALKGRVFVRCAVDGGGGSGGGGSGGGDADSEFEELGQ